MYKLKFKLPKLNLYKENTTGKNNIKRTVSFFLAPFLLTLVLFIMALIFGKRADLFFSQAWYAKIIITYVFLLSLQCFIFAFCYRGAVAFIITAVLAYIFEFINQTMYLLTGDPLLPTDLFLAGNMGEIASFIEIPFTLSEFIGLVLIVAVIIGYIIISKRTTRKTLRFQYKILTSIVLVAFFVTTSYFLAVNRNFRHNTLEYFDVTRRAFNPIEDYQASGSILTFLPRIGDMIVEVPENYSKENVINALNCHNGDINYDYNVQPNIIAIQNEAWWDPTTIKNAEFSIDPMALYHEYAKDSIHVKTGFVKTPVFAGGTCMPEFEFLTGMSTLNLPPNTYPYIQSIKGDTASFAWEYKKNNYDTIAIHPYKKNFYERDTAYKFLGFDTFIGHSEMKFAEKRGWYISDESASQEIIRVFEEKKNERAYIFCVTMQNHGGYSTKRYDEYDIEVKSDSLTEEDLICLTDFSQGVFDTMNAFKTLTDYFSNINEPTLIVMYGDHLPLLGNSGETYINGGMIADEYLGWYSSSPNLYETPYIIWANYDISKTHIPEILSPAPLGLEIYKMSGLDNTPDYLKVFDELYKYVPIYHHHMLVMANGIPYGDEHEKQFNPLIANYKLLQYDLLHGKKYASKQ